MTISSTNSQLYPYLPGGAQGNSAPSVLNNLNVKTAASTDPTQLSLNSHQSQLSSLGPDIQNGTTSIGMVQIAQKALATLNTDAEQLSTISEQLSNPSISPDKKTQLQQETASIIQRMKDAIAGATFNEKSVFGNVSSAIAGLSVKTGVIAPDLSTLDINNPQTISNFLKTISTSQSTLGSQIVNISNAMTASMNQTLFQSLNDGNTDNTDYFSQSYMSLQQNVMSLNSQAISKSHNTAAMQSSIATLLG